MRVRVDGVGLWFDVEGQGLVPEGEGMRQRPTLLLLHGGPGFDHTSFKPYFSALTDVAQVVYLDHRGQGRSGGEFCAAGADPAGWTLARWADDVRGFCDALGIVKPVVLGNSFGGFVAQAYAQRHPGHAGGLILSSTAARMDLPRILAAFERQGGKAARDAAERFWTDVTAAGLEPYQRECMTLYTTSHPHGFPGSRRAILRPEVLEHFSGRAGEMWGMDFRPALPGITTPTLVLAGDQDPITPWEASAEIASLLPAGSHRFVRFPDCGHGVFRDNPAGAMAVIRDFITGLPG
ncbi:MAG: hypothetical protein RLY86_2312 [Pseudomonadota bacterium]|jgi:proline iminopeptidase